MMFKLVLIACLTIGGLNLVSARGPFYYYGSDLSIEEAREAEKLNPHLAKLNSALSLELAKNDDPKAIMDLVKRELSHVKRGLLGGVKTEEKALEAFVALEKTIGKCDYENYKILATVYHAIRVDVDINGWKRIERVSKVLHDYRAKHAEECSKTYRANFEKLLENVPKDAKDKVENALSTLGPSSFGELTGRIGSIKYGYKNKASIPTPRFAGSRQALSSIAHQIGRSLVQTPVSQQLISINAGGKTVYRKMTKDILDQYLFEPCKVYHNHFDAVAAPARFDAKINDAFLRRSSFDDEFSDIIGYNRLCRSLLEEREKLYKPLIKVWAKLEG